MTDENFLKTNNARSLWHPMTSPSNSLKNAPIIVTGAQGVRITDIDGHEVVDAVGGPLERQPRLLLPADQRHLRRPARGAAILLTALFI